MQFSLETETGKKKTSGEKVGVDTGINVLAALSSGLKLGLDIKALIEAINRCEYASKRQKRLRRALRQRIDEVAKEIMLLAPALMVVEQLSHVTSKTKQRRRLGRKTRRLLSAVDLSLLVGAASYGMPMEPCFISQCASSLYQSAMFTMWSH